MWLDYKRAATAALTVHNPFFSGTEDEQRIRKHLILPRWLHQIWIKQIRSFPGNQKKLRSKKECTRVARKTSKNHPLTFFSFTRFTDYQVSKWRIYRFTGVLCRHFLKWFTRPLTCTKAATFRKSRWRFSSLVEWRKRKTSPGRQLASKLRPKTNGISLTSSYEEDRALSDYRYKTWLDFYRQGNWKRLSNLIWQFTSFKTTWFAKTEFYRQLDRIN